MTPLEFAEGHRDELGPQAELVISRLRRESRWGELSWRWGCPTSPAAP